MPRIISDRFLAVLSISVLTAGLAGCELGEKIPLKPIEMASRFCGDGQALYRAGSILFCAYPTQRWPAHITYSVAGPSADAFDREVRDVVATARCLTGRTFEAVPDGEFHATIDNKIVPADAAGRVRHDDNSFSLHSQLGLPRTGKAEVRTINASPDVVGRDFEKGVWDFLGIKRPKPIALAYHAFKAADQTPPPPMEAPDGARFCQPGMTLMQTYDVYFCASPKHRWTTASYALLSEKTGFDDVAPVVAQFANRLTGVRLTPSHKPELLIVLTEYELTKTTFAELLQKHDIEPRDPTVEADHLQHSFRDDVREALGPTLGKPIAAAMADFMSTTSSAEYEDGRAITTVIGLHDRSTVDAESEIEQSFFDLLQVKLPAYHPPAACEGARKPEASR